MCSCWDFYLPTAEYLCRPEGIELKCPRCEFDNRDGAKFCLDCGEKLERDCPQCGRAFSLSAKFCDECGERLEQVPKIEAVESGVKGERRNVTVLFSDLLGYTSLSEKLDP
ncbi:MAG: hypothetical protein COZ11_14870 [Deltaproteobacteria bacterium CG_4_10_14_3_um_filter_51_14]|nr:MAG: hypothetical protein COZ11_14870 [Deltaproteobacteria bacterium CG_4_10_14_3_um_filter_51_14]